MRNALLTSVLLLLGGIALRPAAAQDVSRERYFRGDVQVARFDTLQNLPTERVPGGRIDRREGVYRARYRITDRVDAGLTATEAALQHVSRDARVYGIEDPDEQLQVTTVRRGVGASHVRFRQMLNGVPVYGREVTVSLDRNGQPTMVVNGFAPHLNQVDAFDTAPRISSSQAVRIVQTASTRGIDVTDPELVVYPSKPPRLAWRLAASARDGAAQFEALVDARSGEIIKILDITLHGRSQASGLLRQSPASQARVRSEVSGGDADVESGRAQSEEAGSVQRVDGAGYVFDPDPLTTAGVEYGGQFVDNSDADTDGLTSQLFEVTLHDISQGTDGLYRLEGPYVIIDGSSTGYEPPAESSPTAFKYTRSNDYFEAVMAYYHIDKSQRYVQSLDVGFPIKAEPTPVNPHGLSDDDSNYDLVNDLIRFGTGGIDDAEDADVIWHEYAHALLNATVPGLYTGFEGQALHEGWADYWAASYSRFLSEEDPQVPEHDWKHIYTWDGNWTCWPGRTLDHTGTYPDDMGYDPPGCQVMRDVYQWGIHWATTLMQIYPHVGRAVLDRLNLASHAYLAQGASLADAAEALLQADQDLYAGVHSSILVHYLDQAGYLDAALYGPIITHEPLPTTEQVGGFVQIEASVAAATAPIDSVMVFYGTDGEPSNRILLQPADGISYEGELALPDEPAVVSYYIEAVDEAGRRRRLPASAPGELFTFAVGPDLVAPTIMHEELAEVPQIAWPADLFVLAIDDLGIDSVWVEYEVLDPGGFQQDAGSFRLELSDSVYFGRFPESGAPVEVGGEIRYRIHALDFSSTGNLTSLPEDDWFTARVTDAPVYRSYDFEGMGPVVSATGVWARGRADYGIRFAHSGESVWATNPYGAYPAAAGQSLLDLPPLDLAALPEAYLVFWHWYDFEHDGGAEPGKFVDSGLWDGGNVKASVDGGEIWEVLEPQGGYSGRLSPDYGNPLGGEVAFGGYSFGWRREIVPLPTADSVLVRFAFGTDNSNEQESRYFAGWVLDDVSIVSELPVDDELPVMLSLPPDRVVWDAGSGSAPEAAVEVGDDTGVEAVLSRYEISSDGEPRSGSMRFAMSETDPGIFHGAVAAASHFEAGDRITYQLVVRDFDGNEAIFGDPFVVEVLAVQSVSALDSAVPTGGWHLDAGTWTVRGDSDQPTSSLILEPFVLPEDVERAELLLEHSYILGGGLGANVKLSADDGRSWSLIEPQGGYPATLSGQHPMAGQGIFADTTANGKARFDLSSYAGREVRLRLDFAQTRPFVPGEGWFIQDASFQAFSENGSFVTPLELTLNGNFPDPVSDRTTITYTIPEATAARLSVYDVMGRRVAVIRHARHEPGTYTINYAPDGLANGVYMLYLETPIGVRTETMVVVR